MRAVQSNLQKERVKELKIYRTVCMEGGPSTFDAHGEKEKNIEKLQHSDKI